jgi:hypothetical protein
MDDLTNNASKTSKGRFEKYLHLALLLLVSPFAVSLLSFYLSYAHQAWFSLDDFQFVASQRDPHFTLFMNWRIVEAPFSPANNPFLTDFGRPVGKNLYWWLTGNVFGRDAAAYFYFNFVIICSSARLAGAIIRKRFGLPAGVACGLAYLCLPATVWNYGWLSNEQHLLGDFFALLFVYYLCRRDPSSLRNRDYIVLSLIFIAAIFSVISSAGVMMFPGVIYMQRRLHGERGGNRLLWLTGFLALCTVFLLLCLRPLNSGVYATSVNFSTFISGLNFYFGRWLPLIAALVLVNAFVGVWKRNWFIVGALTASCVSYAFFGFLPIQRYVNYCSLVLELLVLASVATVMTLLPAINWLRAITSATLALLLFTLPWTGAISLFKSYPRGAQDKIYLAGIERFAAQNPLLHRYCFYNPPTANYPNAWMTQSLGLAFHDYLPSSDQFVTLASATPNQGCTVLGVLGLRKIVLKRVP